MLLYANYFLILFRQLFSNLVIMIKYISVRFQILKKCSKIISEKLVRADNFSLITKNLDSSPFLKIIYINGLCNVIFIGFANLKIITIAKRN